MRKQPIPPRPIHDQTILDLLAIYPGSQRKKFAESVRKFQKRNGAMEEWNGGLIPDLWWIDEQCMSVICIEVENTNNISDNKMEAYEYLRSLLDFEDLEFHLIRSDKRGNLSPIPIPCPRPGDERRSQTILDLTHIYCIKDGERRAAERQKWLEKNPGFDRTNYFKRLFAGAA